MSDKKMDFGIFSNEKQRSERAYISVDSQGRIYMNADTQKLFGITKSVPMEIQLGFKDGTIYLIKAGSKHFDAEKKPFRFSGDRAYASAKTFIETVGIKVKPTEDTEKKSHKYLLDEQFTQFEGVYAFIHEDIMLAREEAEAAAKEKAEAAKSQRGGNRKQQAEAAAKANKTVTA